MALQWPTTGSIGTYILMNVGTLGPITQGAYTIVGLMLPKNARGCLLGIMRTSASYDREIILDSGLFYGASDFSTPPYTADSTGTKWQWIGQRKAAGSNVYEWSYRDYTGGGSISHTASTGAHGDFAGAATLIRIGQGDNESRNGIAVIALWNRRISDTEMATVMGSSASAIMTVAPDALFLFNVAGASSLTDATGNGATYNSTAGTPANITTLTDPAGYDFSLSTPVIPGSTPSQERFGSHVLNPSTGLFVPASISSGERFGSGVLTPGTTAVTPGVNTSQERFGSGLISAGTATATPGVNTSQERFGSGVLSPGTASAVPGINPSAEQFGSATIDVAGSASIAHGSTPSGERWGSASVSTTAGTPQSFAPGVIGSSEQYGTHVLSPGAVTFTPGTINPTEQFGTGVMTGASGTTAPGSIGTQERWGSATLAGSPSAIAPGTIGPCQRWGSASLDFNTATPFAPGSVRSAERWGSSMIEYGARTVTHIVKLERHKFEVEVGPQEFAVRNNRKIYEVEME